MAQFDVLSTVFQLYQDSGKVLMKGCARGTLSPLEKFPPQVGHEPGTTRLLCIAKYLYFIMSDDKTTSDATLYHRKLVERLSTRERYR